MTITLHPLAAGAVIILAFLAGRFLGKRENEPLRKRHRVQFLEEMSRLKEEYIITMKPAELASLLKTTRQRTWKRAMKHAWWRYRGADMVFGSIFALIIMVATFIALAFPSLKGLVSRLLL